MLAHLTRRADSIHARARRVTVVIVVAALGVGFGQSVAAAAGRAGEKAVNYTDRQAYGISCVSAKFCVDAGYMTDRNITVETPYVLIGSGATWRWEAPPEPPGGDAGFNGISCVSTKFCLAVGDQGPTDESSSTAIAETFGPKGWSVTKFPGLSNQSSFASVSCVSAKWCVAVGENGSMSRPVAELWDGTTWANLAAPAPKPAGAAAVFNAVSCLLKTYCLAVGSVQVPQGDGHPEPTAIAETYNGHSWSAAHLPASGYDSELEAVSCVMSHGSAWCEAVGDATFHTHPPIPLAETYSDGKWSLASGIGVPNGVSPSLSGVSCPVAGWCRAVGNSGFADPFAESLSGGKWALDPLPQPKGAEVVFGGVSCASTTACGADGLFETADYEGAALKAWNTGKHWKYSS